MDGSILVVDDDREVQAYLQLALAVMGRSVVADDGQGVSLEASPSLAFVDLLLGNQDGLPLIVDLLARGVPVVAISGLAPDAARLPPPGRRGPRCSASPSRSPSCATSRGVCCRRISERSGRRGSAG
ncbi:MAG: response regulator [bacterium]